MAGFYVYETKDVTITIFPPGALQDLKDCICSIVQAHIKVEKTLADMTIVGDSLKFHLSQEETALFCPGLPAYVQVNLYYEDTERDTTTTGMLEVMDNLHKAVMS